MNRPYFENSGPKTGANLAVYRVTDIITYGLLYFLEKLKTGGD